MVEPSSQNLSEDRLLGIIQNYSPFISLSILQDFQLMQANVSVLMNLDYGYENLRIFIPIFNSNNIYQNRHICLHQLKILQNTQGNKGRIILFFTQKSNHNGKFDGIITSSKVINPVTYYYFIKSHQSSTSMSIAILVNVVGPILSTLYHFY